jgi:palmitoyl-protein thioesterase
VNLAHLDALVLVLFTKDRTVIPKESSWFGSYPSIPESEGEEEGYGGENRIVPMREQPLYVEDWIGLRTLDESGSVVLVPCDAEHMRLSLECWQPLVEKYVGSRL